MTQHSTHEDTDDDKGLTMQDQGPSYGTSYNESTPGETEANRRRSFGEQDEQTQQPNQRDDR